MQGKCLLPWFQSQSRWSSSHSMTLTLHWHDGRSPQDWTRLQSAQLSSEALQCVVTTKRC
jgi:hypothetical protein